MADDAEIRSASDNLPNEKTNDKENSTSTDENVIVENKGKRRVLGLCLMSLAGFYVVLSNTLVQYIHTTYLDIDISSLTILFTRSVITVFMSIIFMCISKRNPFPSKQETLVLTALGLTGVGATLLMYVALTIIPVGDVTVINFTAPIFTTGLSVVFLGESCTFIDAFLGFIGFCGIFVMTRPTIVFGQQDYDSESLSECVTGGENQITLVGNDYMYGVAYTLLGAFLVSVYFILNKLTSKNGDVILNIFYVGVVGVILPTIITCITKQPYNFSKRWEIWVLLLFIGILSVIHLLLLAESLQFEEAGPAALIRNADSIYAFGLQYIVLGIPPNGLTILGAAIVGTSSTAIGICRYISANRK